MTHDPREALEIVQQMIRGEPMSAWITDTRTMKSLGDVVQEALTASPGEQKPPPAAGQDKEYPFDDERFNKGVQHVVDLIARELGVTDWIAGDGSEDYDCDLWQTILNILAAKGLYDKDEGEFKALRREAPAPEGVASIVTCCVTGAIPGDGGACGDCDPCIMGEASVPDAVKRLIAEKNSLIQRISELEDALASCPDAGGGAREAFVSVLASLAAAISLLERMPKAKKAAPSDTMFAIMLDDYRKALETGRAALSNPPAAVESNASVEARLREAVLVSIDMIKNCAGAPTNPDSLPQMVQVYLQQAISAVGDEAKKSEGSPANPDQGLASQHEYPDESRSGRNSSRNQSAPSDPTAERREIVARPAAFLAWAVDMFGSVAKLRSERLMRFVEEAIELAHAESMERTTLDAIANRVYSRPPGETPKEIGQAQACLETFAENIGLSSDVEAEREWQRVQSIPRDEWQQRHTAKVAIGIAALDGGAGA